ncbi:hypothetical protein [Maribacter flavus]|uniref:Tannase/feruloyl esterase family alpha/beta hydrolase n=1 Tax=Maribacter flavus TaxID=1658664 RepID=A0A5B2TMS5_9FLAO|nr:hypothetical protein [Maribacter flavus]KAA2215767.1 hypothetical protein F0361_16360 [Maribacter flavus]
MKNLFNSILLTTLFILIGQNSMAQDDLTMKNWVLDTNDSIFTKPYIDIDKWYDASGGYRYIHGGFTGTNTKFSFYFPEKKNYSGRFFQYITPFPDNENLAQGNQGESDVIGFSVSNGAYLVETNGGGPTDFSNPMANDPTIGAYRANAAAAQFSRLVAQTLFGGSRPFGYCFGGSGGAYRTVGGLENTNAVWDGAVPFVMGSPMAIPNSFTFRMHAMRILKDKFPQIVDALEPGGSGDPYAGLNEEEKAALEEATKMGFPPKAWFAYKEMGIHGFLVLYNGVVMADQAYFNEDFWSKEGYLGAHPTQSLLDARIQEKTKIKRIIEIDEAVAIGLSEPLSEEDRGSADKAWKNTGEVKGGKPVGYFLENTMPKVGFMGGDLLILSGEAEGQRLQIDKLDADKVSLAPTNPLNILAKLKPGDEVQVDNSNFLAVQTYHRHQIPGPEYVVYEQFKDSLGNPLYPQRPMLLGPLFTMGAAGSVPTGKYNGKVILLGSLWDSEAHPWQQAWYHDRVKEHLGDKTNDNFRIWFTDHANHADASNSGHELHIVSYLGVVQQALLDLSDWVEKGIAPAQSTHYEIIDGQVVVSDNADVRLGIQPLVIAKANGGERANVKVGEKVHFSTEITLPKDTGYIVSVAWDFDGSGNFENEIRIPPGKSELTLETSHAFNEKGTHFPTVRIASQRDGNKDIPFTLIRNLDRVRVIVK